jgi:hypothetical protein
MIKRLLNFILLSNGISTDDDPDTKRDKWAEFREERERWEHERNLERAAPRDSAQPSGTEMRQAR